jgi:cation-transporting ATPase E
MIILGYSQAAVRLAQKGALIQQSNAIESVSNVTILCTDKTGTLTTNRITYDDLYPVGVDEAELKHALGVFANSATTSNKTGQAIIDGLGGNQQPFLDEVPFSSARKWSALSFDGVTGQDASLLGTYVLGAPEMLQSKLNLDGDVRQQFQARTEKGLRVLAFARNSEVTNIHDSNDEPVLPQLELLGIVSLSDELRPHLKEALTDFAENEVQLKIISGDNPHTVAALARQAGLQGDLKAISGTELEHMGDSEIIQAANEYTIFGRITPNQKEALVGGLHEQGEYVAMIGDGVNDVLSLKKADVGIAMESGSSAARGVAKMILLGDSFAALPSAFTEGQRIVNGLKDILRLEVSRTIYLSLIMIAIPLIGLGFPFTPRQAMVFAFFATGGPTLGLSFWSQAGRVNRRSVFQEISHFIFPAGITIMIFGVAMYILAFYLTYNKIIDVPVTPEMIADFQSYFNLAFEIPSSEQFRFEVAQFAAQTTLVIFGVLAALWLVVFVQPPHKWFAGGDEFSGDWRPTALAGGLVVAFTLLMAIEPVRRLFEFIPLPPSGYVFIVSMVLVWMLFVRLLWRKRWLERFLGIDSQD